MTKEKAKKIYSYLLKTDQGFCFYEGILIDRQKCLDTINK